MRQRRSLQQRALDVAGEVMPAIGQIFVGAVVLYAFGRLVGGAA